MSAKELETQEIESDTIERALNAILAKRKWVLLYEAAQDKGSILLAKPESDLEQTTLALEFAAKLLKEGTRYRGKKGDLTIAHGGAH